MGESMNREMNERMNERMNLNWGGGGDFFTGKFCLKFEPRSGSVISGLVNRPISFKVRIF